MPKSTRNSLSKEDIEEELLNNDLMSTGGVESPGRLQLMDVEEKKNLLKGIKQSKEEFQPKPNSSSFNQPVLDNSPSNFPSLSSSAKSNTRTKLKLPRRPPGLEATHSDESTDKCITLLDDEEVVKILFSLPFCISDGAPLLPMPERAQRRHRNPYFVMQDEKPGAALKRMLAHHNTWKNMYITETSKIESHALGEDIEDSDSKKQKDSPKNDLFEEKENDCYTFGSASPVQTPKVYSGARKRDTNLGSDIHLQTNTYHVLRKTSRDSDCEEIEPCSKYEEPKINESLTTVRPRNKRNRKQLYGQEKGQGYVDTLELDQEKKWDPQTSVWRDPQSPSSSSLNNQNQTRSAQMVEGEKVQCPICQRNFPKTKVENHAALCEGYKMDVEEEG